jgi:sugar O-acyltransferase (sialic acid O-acetyltransferase NeuD family)
MSGLLIVGAGGHGKVVADAARLMKQWDRIAFLDDRYPAITLVSGHPVLGAIHQAVDFIADYPALAVAIGDNELRVNLICGLSQRGFVLPPIIHPSAAVSESVCLGSGTVVFAQAAINADTAIGMGAIINTGATVDHDCVLGKGVHLSPGAHLAGGVSIGDFSWIGVGASVIQGITLGDRVTVGAGSVVHRDVKGGARIAGVPARVLKPA